MTRLDNVNTTSIVSPIRVAADVIVRPLAAMDHVAAKRLWPAALVVESLATLLARLSDLIEESHQVSIPLAALPPDLAATLGTLIDSPVGVGAWALTSPLALVFTTAVLYVIGGLLGGQRDYAALLATQGYASLPSMLAAMMSLGLAVGGAGRPLVSEALGWGFLVWSLALGVLGVRAALHLPLARAATVVLLLPVILAGIMLPVATGLVLVVLRQPLPGGAVILPIGSCLVVLAVVKLFPRRLPVAG
jgi:hypothetical protein